MIVDNHVFCTALQRRMRSGISTQLVNALELKRMLTSLATYTKGICFRWRQVGEMWMKHHCRVIDVKDKTAVFFDEVENRYYLVRINSIMQFDLDERFQQFQPNYHYEVAPAPELE
jgi:hypothetical protein